MSSVLCGEPVEDQYGTLHYRDVSHGGVQIESRLYAAHAGRVLAAHRVRVTEKMAVQEVFRCLPVPAYLPDSTEPRRLREMN